MENKKTAPKELWIPHYSFAKHWANPEKFPREDDNCVLIFTEKDQSLLSVKCSKYIHSSEVERLLAEKDAEIERLKAKYEAPRKHWNEGF